MLTVGDKFPAFSLQAAVSREKGKEFKEISDDDVPGQVAGRLLLADGLHVHLPDRDRRVRQAQRRLRGPRRAGARRSAPTTTTSHLAWRNNHADLKDLPFPMLADTKRELSRARSASCTRRTACALRATFIVDPEGVIRWVSVNDLSVGRNVDEVLRTLDALQTDELCPCNWKKGEETLKAALSA